MIVTATFKVSDYDWHTEPAEIALDVLRKFAKKVFEIERIPEENTTRPTCVMRVVFEPSKFPSGIKDLEEILNDAIRRAELTSLGSDKKFYTSGVKIHKIVFQGRDWTTYLTKKVFDKVAGHGRGREEV